MRMLKWSVIGMGVLLVAGTVFLVATLFGLGVRNLQTHDRVHSIVRFPEGATVQPLGCAAERCSFHVITPPVRGRARGEAIWQIDPNTGHIHTVLEMAVEHR